MRKKSLGEFFFCVISVLYIARKFFYSAAFGASRDLNTQDGIETGGGSRTKNTQKRVGFNRFYRISPARSAG